MSEDLILIRVNCPTSDVAETISIALVAERFAACANIEAPVVSVYEWEGQMETATEFVVILKTRADLFDAASARIKSLHPHEVPAILAIPLSHAEPSFAQWVVDNTRD